MVRGGSCQFAGVLIESVMSNWIMRMHEFDEWMKSQMKKEGVEWVNRSDMRPVVKWMERKIRWGGLESNGMCQIFYRYLRYREKSSD